MIDKYWNLSRYKMEQLDKKKTVVIIPLGALEQHGNQAPLGTDSLIADSISFNGKVALPWMGEDFLTSEKKPIGIGGNPSGASTAKGEVILDINSEEIASGIISVLESI